MIAHPENVVAKGLADPDIVARVHALRGCVRFCQELVRNAHVRSHSNSQCDVSMCSRGDGGQQANISDVPLRKSSIKVSHKSR